MCVILDLIFYPIICLCTFFLVMHLYFWLKKTVITVLVWASMIWNSRPLDRSFSVLLKTMPQARDMFCIYMWERHSVTLKMNDC